MKKIFQSLKTVNYKLWLAILVTFLMPTIYKTFRIFLLGSYPNSSGLDIASQLQWLDLFYEVIQEALILPLFFILGKYINDKKDFSNKVRGGLIITIIIYSCLSVFIIIFARPLVKLMAQRPELVDETVKYISLETVASLFSTLVKFLTIVLITIKKDKFIYITLGIQMILSVVLDIFLVSNLNVSFKTGVNGIPITNIIVNIVLIIVVSIILIKENINVFKFSKSSYKWAKEWFHVGKYSGLESFIRNLAFMIMIVRMINVVAEQGNYWITNNFIWGWLLLPGLALSDLVKQEIAENKKNIESKTIGYIMLTTIFALVWLLSIPLWKPFLKHVMNVKDYELVFKIALIQTPFYLLFLYNSNIFDATFYGRGKTNYMLYQSIVIDVFYYGLMFVLYITKVFKPSIIGISLMFGIGMALDFIPTMILYIRLLRKENLRLSVIDR